ncbi:MAG: hypothetical protein ACI828_002012 [Flavobacteriales bacterium]|jgi:hypothetical protein
MGLEIKDISGVICLKGKVSNSHLQDLKGYFKALLTVQDTVNINLCQIKKGTKKLTSVLDSLKEELSKGKTLNYYCFTEPAASKLYAELNHPSNYYQAT